MALTGKLEGEIELHSSATKFFNVFATQIHDLPNISDVIHDAKLHQGDWHGVGPDSVKHWTFFADGRVQTTKEHIDEIDHANRTMTFNLFGGDVGKKYKTLKKKLQVTENGSGSVAHWTYEYEKLHEGIPPPQAYSEYITKLIKDVDAHIN